jgi:hypothetical protein
MDPSSFWAMLWGDAAQYHQLQIEHDTVWLPCSNRRAFTRLIVAGDCMVSVVPRTTRHPLDLGQAWVLWTRLERPGCAEKLSRLAVAPTLVLREGRSSRRTALWALSAPLWGEWITRATERLSYALGGRRGAADASALIPSPFTRQTFGRRTPARVYQEFESDSRATAREIVGGLRDAPDPDAWREAA